MPAYSATKRKLIGRGRSVPVGSGKLCQPDAEEDVEGVIRTRNELIVLLWGPLVSIRQGR